MLLCYTPTAAPHKALGAAGDAGRTAQHRYAAAPRPAPRTEPRRGEHRHIHTTQQKPAESSHTAWSLNRMFILGLKFKLLCTPRRERERNRSPMRHRDGMRVASIATRHTIGRIAVVYRQPRGPVSRFEGGKRRGACEASSMHRPPTCGSIEACRKQQAFRCTRLAHSTSHSPA